MGLHSILGVLLVADFVLSSVVILREKRDDASLVSFEGASDGDMIRDRVAYQRVERWWSAGYRQGLARASRKEAVIDYSLPTPIEPCALSISSFKMTSNLGRPGRVNSATTFIEAKSAASSQMPASAPPSTPLPIKTMLSAR